MDKDQEIERLRQENQELKAALQEALASMAQLSQQVHELQARLKKDSHNSHLPPSSDRFARQPKSLRKKSEKPSGGQAGHPGHHLLMVKTPDQIIVHAPAICSACQHELTGQPVVRWVRRQVIDVPVPHLVVTEHQAQSKCCPHCQRITSAPFPEDVTAPVQYGPAIQAMAVALSQVHLLPDERVCQVLAEMVGVCLSVGSVHSWITRCAQHLSPVEQAIKTALQQAPVLHQDETGLYVGGKRQWMHVCATSTLTHYGRHAKRGREAMDAIGIAPAFKGMSVHDGWDSYQGYAYGHALCNVHHLRELTWVEETFKQDWASQLKAVLLDMKAATTQARQAGSLQVDATLRHALVQRYETLLTQAESTLPPDPPPKPGQRGRPKRHPARCLWDRLRTSQHQVLAFLHNLAVPFDNSQAERDIRMVKVQQKVSGCFRSPAGADAFCRIRGYISTMRKQGHALLPVLEGALAGYPVFPAF
ncbi:MAG: IS66 family transposase [Ktedonobacteraceae bacterium]